MDKELHEYMPNTCEVQAIEELSELIQAICKVQRKQGNKAIENLKEEIADVLIMIDSIQGKYNIKDLEIAERMNFKVKRMKNRFNSGEYM